MAVKRKYDSTKRQQQALATRRSIIDAAHRLFLERGYVGTSVAAIAEEAGVAVQTVYATFGNKVSVLSTVLDVSIVGDDEPIPVSRREEVARARAEPDQRRRVDLFAGIMATNLARAAPITEVCRAAADADEAAGELWNTVKDQRLGGMTDAAGVIAGEDGLAVSVDEAAELLWIVASPEVFLLSTVDRGWSTTRYRSWLANTVEQMLLEPTARSGSPGTGSPRRGKHSS